MNLIKIKNIILLTKTKMRIMLRNKPLMALIMLLPVIFNLFVCRIFINKDDTRKLPIALVDEDKSITSRKIIKGLYDNELLKCTVTDKKAAYTLLKKEKVECLYIFKTGMENRIHNGNTNGIIQVSYLANNISSSGINDILAGEIMPYICTSIASREGEKLYKKYGIEDKDISNKISEESFTTVNELPLDINNSISSGKNVNYSLINYNIIKQKSIFGIISIFITFFLFTYCIIIIKEAKLKITSRIKLSPVNDFEIYISNLISFEIIGLLITIIEFMLLNYVFRISILDKLASIIFIYFIYIFSVCSFLMVIVKLLNNSTAFQSFIPIIILFFSIISGCMISTEMFPSKIKILSYLVPSYWLQDGIVQIIIYNLKLIKIQKSLFALILMGLLGTVICFRLPSSNTMHSS